MSDSKMPEGYYVGRVLLEEERTRAMVDTFLAMKMPDDFHPDGAIKFDRERALSNPHEWPTGTNLFDADQIRQVFMTCIPPECFGEDDCSTRCLSTCPWAKKCGEASGRVGERVKAELAKRGA